jgi:hypothetical protein
MIAVRSLTSSSYINPVIDCDACPFVPDGWKVEEHQKGGSFQWDASKVQLWLAEGQRNGKWLECNKLRKELSGKPVLNANVLDYLLKNQLLIPEEWRGKSIFFWGTVYRNSVGGLYVRYLHCSGGEWCWDYEWFARECNGNHPAALLAN